MRGIRKYIIISHKRNVMKIAMFTDAYWPRVNGVTVSVDSFSRALAKEGHDVLIVCLQYPQDDENNFVSLKNGMEIDNEKHLKILRVPSFPSFITKEDRIGKIYKFKWVADNVCDFNPDVIHIQTEFIICEFGIWYGKMHNLPIIYTFHTMWDDYAPNYFPSLSPRIVSIIVNKILKGILKHTYRVIVPTVQMESVVKKYKHNVKTSVLPTGIDIKLFQHDENEIAAFRDKLEEHFPKLKGKKILLFAGRVAKEKNIEFLFKILPEILEKHPDVILLIAGSGPDIDYLKEEAHKLNIDDYCVFPGYFTRGDLSFVYSISEVFLFPSLTDTQGLVTLEAMLTGTPVVAIGAMGTLTVMGGDNGGFMVSNNTYEFTARVLELLGNKELYNLKAEEAKLHASSWSIEEMTKKLVVLYKNMITDYINEFGYRITPVWELLIQKRWWKINQKILVKKIRQKFKK